MLCCETLVKHIIPVTWCTQINKRSLPRLCSSSCLVPVLSRSWFSIYVDILLFYCVVFLFCLVNRTKVLFIDYEFQLIQSINCNILSYLRPTSFIFEATFITWLRNLLPWVLCTIVLQLTSKFCFYSVLPLLKFWFCTIKLFIAPIWSF